MNTNMMLCNVLMRCLRSLFTDVRKRRKRHWVRKWRWLPLNPSQPLAVGE
jgi:hypothetical protein